jgi:hypothetical protein
MNRSALQNLYAWNRFLLVGGLILALLGGGGIATAFAIERENMTVARVAGFGGIGLCAVAVLMMIAGGIVGMVLLYSSWKVIQDGHARASPGLAVGLLFVPFFNLYWVFVAYYGLAADMNQFLDRHRIGAQRVPAGLGIAYGVLILLSGVPVIGIALALANMFIYLRLMKSVADTGTAIAAQTQPSVAPAPALMAAKI